MPDAYDLRNIVELFDSETEDYLEAVEIPDHRKKDLFLLMEWQTPEDELYCYDLTLQQLRVISEWVGRDLISPLWTTQLSGVAKR